MEELHKIQNVNYSESCGLKTYIKALYRVVRHKVCRGQGSSQLEDAHIPMCFLLSKPEQKEYESI